VNESAERAMQRRLVQLQREQEHLHLVAAHSLICQLLDPAPSRRLSAERAAEVKQHPFFRPVGPLARCVEWDAIAEGRAAPADISFDRQLGLSISHHYS
jgi:hypothetical protein